MAKSVKITPRIGVWSSIGFVVLFMVGAISSNVATTTTYPRPSAGSAEVHAYFAENAGMVGFLSLTQAAAALCLLLFTGVLAAALRSVRKTPTEAGWVVMGGSLAAGFLFVSALLLWALSQETVVADPEGTVALHQFVFGAGGVGHVVPLGLLVGASALAALRHQLHPRWLSVVGIVSGALSVASLLTLLVLGPLVALIPRAGSPRSST